MNTKEKIAVMQAFEDGSKIQYKADCAGCDWRTIDDPNWNWAGGDYRIKPQPKVMFINEYGNSRYEYAYDESEQAHSSAGDGVKRIAAPYIELTPEVKTALEKSGVGHE